MKNRPEKGQSLVEFSVSLIVVLIILSGIIDLGRLFFYYIAMRDAAQEGIVYGMITPADCSGIVSRTQSLLSSEADVQVMINGKTCAAAVADDADLADNTPPTGPEDGCSGNTIEVTVIDDDFPITMPFLGTIIGSNTLRLEAPVTGTILRPQCDD